GRDYTSGVHDGVLIVPSSVCSVAREVWKLDDNPILPATSINENDAGNITDLLSRPQTLQRALYLYWSLVVTQREELSLLGNGLFSGSSLKLVVDGMQGAGTSRSPYEGLDGQGNEKRFQAYAEPAKSETDVPYLYFLRLLLMQLDLLQVQNTTLKAVS